MQVTFDDQCTMEVLEVFGKYLSTIVLEPKPGGE